MKLSKEARAEFAKQGKKGGEKRAKTLSAEERKEIASKAAAVRWKDKKV